MNRNAQLGLIFIGMIAAVGFHIQMKPQAPAMIRSIKNTLSKMRVEESRLFAMTLGEHSKLLYPKFFYYLVGGGAKTTWPSIQSGALKGDSPASDSLVEGYVGLINQITGPQSELGAFLLREGFESCSQLPSNSTSYSYDDPTHGTLSVTLSDSTKGIPDGLRTSGFFDKKIVIQNKAGYRIAVLHMSCDGSVGVQMMRLKIPLDKSGSDEEIEALIERSEDDSYMHLQLVIQNNDNRDIVLKFLVDENQKYHIYLAYSADTSKGESTEYPSLFLAGLSGKAQSSPIKLNLMASKSDGSSKSQISSLKDLELEPDISIEKVNTKNQFCLDMEGANSSTSCEALASPGKIYVSGLLEWNLNSLILFTQTKNPLLSISNY